LERTLEQLQTVADPAARFLGQSTQLLQGGVINNDEMVNPVY